MPDTTSILSNLNTTIDQFHQRFPNPLPVGITIQSAFRDEFETIVARAIASKEPATTILPPGANQLYCGIPVYFCDRQPDPLRVWSDQEMLNAWLRFNQTGECLMVTEVNTAAVQAIATLLLIQGHVQVLDFELAFGELRRLTPASTAILQDALSLNGYEVPELSFVPFAERVNIALAMAIAKQRGWGLQR